MKNYNEFIKLIKLNHANIFREDLIVPNDVHIYLYYDRYNNFNKPPRTLLKGRYLIDMEIRDVSLDQDALDHYINAYRKLNK